MLSSKYTTVSIEKDIKEQLDNVLIVIHWVPLRSSNDKIRYLLHEFEKENKKN